MDIKVLRVVIVEDTQMLSNLLAGWMNTQAELEVAGCAPTVQAGWDLCVATKPDVVLLDIELPDGSGLDLGERLLARFPHIRLLAVSGCISPYAVWRVCQSGVHGFVEKTNYLDELKRAIETIAADGLYFSPLFTKVKDQCLTQPDAFQKILSEREQEVLKCVVAGVDDQWIADRLQISIATVASHRKHIRQKLALHNDRDLIGYARRWGLLAQSETQNSPHATASGGG